MSSPEGAAAVRRASDSWGAACVRVTYARTRALDGVTMPAIPGVISAVVGGDGAGKTTLLRCLAGALAPASGTVTGPGAQATGYFPASSGIYPDLTVAENLAFRATAYHLRGAVAMQRAAELVEQAGLADARDRLAGQLSGGMRQKLGVIAAMLHRPQLLILDEPTTGVDPVSRSGLWLLITSAAADGAAVILSTTYLDDAQRAGSVLVLDAGRQLASGSPDQIVADMPGSVVMVTAASAGRYSQLAWRRAGGWRVWRPPAGFTGAGTGSRRSGLDVAGLARAGAGTPVAADLQDAVTVAALARELAQRADSEAGDDSEQLGRPDEVDEGRTGRAGRAGERHDAGTQGEEWPGAGVAGAGVAGSRVGGGSTAPLAECAAVTCRFGHVTAVREVSIQVWPGEVVGLLGANGAGKTTLIRMLLGLQRPSAGQVALLGEPPSRQTRRRIGYVPQGLGLYDDLTAAENMQFAAAAFGTAPGALPEDIAIRAGVPVGQLPLGLQRRTAFAQALSHRPDLLILDEPTSGVDPLGRARLWDTIARAAREGGGVLVSTHYMEEAGECSRLVIMAGGVVVAAGTADQIIGDAEVTVIETDAWAGAFSRLAAAGLPAALAGRRLRVPGASVAAVRSVLADDPARVFRAPATLEERFFELAVPATTRPVPA
jgi:ABC-2 type transport system ATP-binding protein